MDGEVRLRNCVAERERGRGVLFFEGGECDEFRCRNGRQTNSEAAAADFGQFLRPSCFFGEGVVSC